LVLSLYVNAYEELQARLESALRVIEREFPVMNFGQDISSGTDSINQSVASPDQFREFLAAALPGLLSDAKGKISAMVERIRNVEPFCSNWSYVEDFLVKEGWING